MFAGPLAALLLLVGCTDTAQRPERAADVQPSSRDTATTEPSRAPSSSGPTAAGPSRRPPRDVRLDDLRMATARHVVRQLADDVGPRPGTGPAFRQAVALVARRFEQLRFRVRQIRFPVPGGVSWGVPVQAGRSVNVVATPSGFDPREPHLVVGAHLDTVPQAPGAEDNASGIGVLLAVAQAVSGRRTRLPVVFVAFGAEEPRGPTDDDHHYGSRAYVAAMDERERAGVRGMVSLDRVGVGSVLPVCSATDTPGPLREEVLAAARRAGVAAQPCVGNRASDHWSFVRSGLPGVRIGSTPYAGYHSSRDVTAVIDPPQLRRAARTVVAWVRGP